MPKGNTNMQHSCGFQKISFFKVPKLVPKNDGLAPSFTISTPPVAAMIHDGDAGTGVLCALRDARSAQRIAHSARIRQPAVRPQRSAPATPVMRKGPPSAFNLVMREGGLLSISSGMNHTSPSKSSWAPDSAPTLRAWAVWMMAASRAARSVSVMAD